MALIEGVFRKAGVELFCRRMTQAFMNLRIRGMKLAKFAPVCCCPWRVREDLRPPGRKLGACVVDDLAARALVGRVSSLRSTRHLWDFVWTFCSGRDRISTASSPPVMVRASEPPTKHRRSASIRLTTAANLGTLLSMQIPPIATKTQHPTRHSILLFRSTNESK